MKQLFLYKITFVLLLCFAMIGCTEQYVLQTNTFEDALVVEATITNELKTQQLKLSRTYRFEDNGPAFESGAEVTVTDDAGNVYEFEEDAGVYKSVTAFQAVSGRVYRLNITTTDGRSYISTTEILSAENEMQSIVPTVVTKNGQRGVQINVNSFDPTSSSKFYRYDYEETFKIIAPAWDSDRAIVIPPAGPGALAEIALIPRVGETKTCYKTEYSNDIILTTTSGFSEDRVNFPVRFISNQDYIITHRYSILVRQYIQSLASYSFYKTLKELAGTGSILSQNQPGFFYGNLKSTDNPNEKIIGFFEVSSVSSKRIFFNYEDLFPGEAAPPYIVNCDPLVWGYCFVSENPECKGNQLLSAISANTLLYFDNYFNVEGNYPVYKMVPPPCGDCTTFSSNIIPPFWIN